MLKETVRKSTVGNVMRRTVVIFFLLLVTGLTCVFARDFYTLQGQKLAAEELAAPDKTILLFWTTWCPYCRDQLKFLGSRCAELERQGITVRLVNIGESQSQVMGFISKMGLGHCEVVLDERGSLAEKFGILGFPTYLFYHKGREMTRANVLSEPALNKALEVFNTAR